MKKASILIPTFCHGNLLRYSVISALNQTVEDIEVLVVGDGADSSTHAVMEDLVNKDARVRYFPFDKAPRHGEILRHKVLTEEAQGEIVCYLSDDDLYMPRHVELVYEALKKNDFVNTFAFNILPDKSIYHFPISLEDPWYKNYILTKGNRIPLSNGSHTMEFYKKLPHGWRTTPKGIWTDWYMWQQILQVDGVRALSLQEPTVLHFSSAERKELTGEQREAELKIWHEMIRRPKALSEFIELVKRDRIIWHEKQIERLSNKINKQQLLFTELADAVAVRDEELVRLRMIHQDMLNNYQALCEKYAELANSKML